MGVFSFKRLHRRFIATGFSILKCRIKLHDAEGNKSFCFGMNGCDLTAIEQDKIGANGPQGNPARNIQVDGC